jgi:hypothetical protein
LTVLAFAAAFQTGLRTVLAASAARKIAPKRLLATPSQSCILIVHSIRRLTKLPVTENA